MVRYKVKPDGAAENEELVRAFYDELRRTEPAGLRYATFQSAKASISEAEGCHRPWGSTHLRWSRTRFV
jgi:hypothetical protein